MLRHAFLVLQATLPTVPPHTKLSRLDVLLLAASYIAHLTRVLGLELPGPTWTPCLPGLRYLHPFKVSQGQGGVLEGSCGVLGGCCGCLGGCCGVLGGGMGCRRVFWAKKKRCCGGLWESRRVLWGS